MTDDRTPLDQTTPPQPEMEEVPFSRRTLVAVGILLAIVVALNIVHAMLAE